MAEGPKLTIVADDEWEDFLKTEKVEAWYHVHRALAPGAFSRGDNVDGASVGDGIWCTARVARAANNGDVWAHRLLAHEYMHCMTDWTPTPEQLEELEHPTDAWPAVKHAVRRRFAVNAFTRILRWRSTPKTIWQQYLTWFRETA